MNKFVSIIFSTLLLMSTREAVSALFKAEEFTLDNGLHCVVVENHKAPLIKQMLWYKIGSVDEKIGKGGSAHLLEHLMFRGTTMAPDGEFNRIMEKHGVSDNAFTTHNVTSYHQFADVSRIEIIMALEADRMTHLDFSDEAFEAERNIVYQERMQRVESNPSSPFYEQLNLMLWGFSPYGHPVTGLPQEIQDLSREDIMDFYRKFYVPNNAVLVLSGDIDTEQAKQLIEKYYGNIGGHDISENKFTVERHEMHEVLEMSLPNVNTIKISERYLLPKHDELKKRIYDYLVLAEYLGGGFTSALYKDLVLEKRIALSINASYNFVSRGESVFSINMVPQQSEDFNGNLTLDLLQEALDVAMRDLTEEKLQKTKHKMSADLVFLNDSPADAAEWIGYMLSTGFSLQETQEYEDNINSVTLEGIRSAYAELMKAPRVSGILTPQKMTNAEGVND